MTKALLTAAALVALTLVMQHAALGQPQSDRPFSTLQSVKPKRMDERHAATRPPRPPVPAVMPATEPKVALPKPEELGDVRPGLGTLAPLASGTFTTANPPGQPPQSSPPPPPTQSQHARPSPWMWFGWH